jgi:probable rRNA maturation factor
MPLDSEIVLDASCNFEPVDALSDLLRCAVDELDEAPRGDWTLVVRLTSDDEIARLHEMYFADPTPTDVISFPSGDDLSDAAGHLGDIVISLDTAAEQAHLGGHSREREVAFLALHGLLHVCGYTDASPEDRQRMLDLQTRLLDSYECVNGTPW